ncbi:hypothetical protein ACIQCR_33875 [Streptomyces sp. NPDC093249]|uniref:hypothetical protein n=1 Tax=unclassified Streptomyces TaxID=2593676 RepID=UPI0037FE9331
MLRRRDFLDAAFASAAVGLPLGYAHGVAAILRAAERGGGVGTEEVATVRRLTETFHGADDRLGGGHGLTLANLGKSVAAQHRHEEAVALWSGSLDFMDGVTSDRNRRAIRSIRSATAGYRRRRIPGAGALHRRAADLLRAQA